MKNTENSKYLIFFAIIIFVFLTLNDALVIFFRGVKSSFLFLDLVRERW